MKKVTHIAEDCNVNPTANNKNNDTAAAKSTYNHSASAGDSGKQQIPRKEESVKELIDADIKAFVRSRHPEQIKEWIFFSRELAELVGITGAVVVYGLYTWIKSPRPAFGYNPIINGRKACYRSTRELAEEDYLGLWDDTTMLKAVNLLEKQVGLIVDRSHEQLHFAMSDKLIRMHESKKGFLGFRIADALTYGVVDAVLLANLDFQTDTFTNCLTDEAGIKYGELSPTKLSKLQKDVKGVMRRFIPKSRDALSDALSRLKENYAILAHPTRTSFYRRVLIGEIVPNFASNASRRSEAKVSSGVAKVSTREAKVSSSHGICMSNANGTSDLQQFSETLDSNRDRNPDRKCLITDPDSLPLVVSVEENKLPPFVENNLLVDNKSLVGTKLRDSAAYLMQLVHDELAGFEQRYATNLAKNNFCFETVYTHDHDDNLVPVRYEDFYDYIDHDINTGLPYSRANEVNYLMEEITTAFCISAYEHTPTDMQKLKELFLEHPLLTTEHIFYLSSCPYADAKYPKAPKRGHDFDFFGRRINNLKQFLRYLPQIIKERHVNSQVSKYAWDVHSRYQYEVDESTGRHLFDYSELEEPFASIAFPKGVPIGYA